MAKLNDEILNCKKDLENKNSGCTKIIEKSKNKYIIN